MVGLTQYLNRITSQHRGKPRFTAWMTAILGPIDDAHRLAATMHKAFTVHDATGVQLDILGSLVGMDRVVTGQFISSQSGAFDDETYRRLIQTKIIRNHWDGRQDSIAAVWAEAMDESLKAVYRDNQDMSIGVDLVGDYAPLDVELVLRGYIIPRPMGVQMIANMRTEANIRIVSTPYCALCANVATISMNAD